MIGFEPHQIVQQALAARDQLLALGSAAGGLRARRSAGEHADQHDADGQRQRDEARRAAVMRQPVEDELDRLAGPHLPAGPGDESLAVGRHLALIRDLR